MPKFVFKSGYSRYYPASGLFVKPGETHDLDSAPDADWQAVEDAQSAAVAPVAEPVTNELAPVVEAAQETAPDVSEDIMHKAEALLEADPELARKLVEEVKNA